VKANEEKSIEREVKIQRSPPGILKKLIE